MREVLEDRNGGRKINADDIRIIAEDEQELETIIWTKSIKGGLT